MRCILHIGPPKTGSTSVQSFIKRNKKSFKDLGIFIPKTRNANMAEFHYANKTKITQGRAATAMGLSKANFETSQIAIRRKMNRQFRKAKAKGYKTLLVTSEGLAQSSAQEISLLKDWLSNFFAEFQIVIALRRQDLRALSTYKNQVMINGAKHKRYLGQSESMKYDTLLEKWANAFGQSSITPILFPDSILEKTDFLQSFCTAIGVEGVYNPQDASTYQKNQNMDGRAVELLRLLNAQQVKSGDASQSAGRRFLELTLSSLDLNEPLKNKPSRAQVETFYNLYKEVTICIRKGTKRYAKPISQTAIACSKRIFPPIQMLQKPQNLTLILWSH